MSDDATVSVACPTCDGAGRIAVARCAAFVGKMAKGGRRERCKRPVRYDPAYYLNWPGREWLRPFCTVHGNALARDSQRVAANGGPG
ncbi:MAG TPA: hypothetical protein VE953_02940 [Terriglobales bacterium]|nr:hypothetical protein [Terriglobales bacterium]